MTTIETSNHTQEKGIFWPWLALAAGFALSWWGLPWLIPQLALGWLADAQAAWYLVRATGMVGYFFLAASTIWGLLLSARLIKQAVAPAISLALHNHLSWAAIGITAVHALLLLFDTYYTYTLPHLLIPFTGPYNPVWVGLGVIGFYIMLLTSLSFYFRRQIGQKRWRRLHYLTFAAFALTTGHAWVAGTDAALLGVMYLASGLLVLFLTTYRILAAISP